MVTHKDDLNKPKVNWLDEMCKDIERRRGELLRERWWVDEVTLSVHIPSEYDSGDWTKEKSKRVSSYFDTRIEAEDYVENHVADKGCELRIRKQGLYRRTVEEWF